MKTITFIRHGQSVANAGGLTVAHHAIPLSSLGELQARTLSALLPAKPPLILSHPSFVRSKPLLLLSRELGKLPPITLCCMNSTISTCL